MSRRAASRGPTMESGDRSTRGRSSENSLASRARLRRTMIREPAAFVVARTSTPRMPSAVSVDWGSVRDRERAPRARTICRRRPSARTRRRSAAGSTNRPIRIGPARSRRASHSPVRPRSCEPQDRGDGAVGDARRPARFQGRAQPAEGGVPDVLERRVARGPLLQGRDEPVAPLLDSGGEAVEKPARDLAGVPDGHRVQERRVERLERARKPPIRRFELAHDAACVSAGRRGLRRSARRESCSLRALVSSTVTPRRSRISAKTFNRSAHHTLGLSKPRARE